MKSLKEFSEAYGRHDAYTRDYHSSISGMGKRQSAAYHADGGANDEGWDDHKPSHKPADHPHSVHINGKKWKTFGSHSHATNVARKIKGATVHKEEVEIQEDQTTSEYKIKKTVGADGKTHTRKIRPHKVHFKNSGNNAEPETKDSIDDKEDMKKEELASFTEFLTPLEESQVDHWKKVQAMDKGSATGGKEEAKKHLAYLNAVHDYHKKYGNDTKKIKDKIEAINRSRIAEELDEAIDPSEIAGNPRMYSADAAKKAYYHKKASDSDKESLAKHLDRYHGNKNWRKPVKEDLEEGYVVRYHNPKSEKHGSEKHFDSQESAQKHAERGNSVDKIGGKYTVHKTNAKGHDVKEEVELDEAMTPQQKTDFDRMMAGAMSRAAYNAKWKKPLKSDSKVIYGKNVKEQVDEAVKTGNEGNGYHGQHPSEKADAAYSKAHATVKKVAGEAGHLRDAKKPNVMVKHYLDSVHGRHLAGREGDHEYIKKDFGKFKKSYKPEMHEEVELDEKAPPGFEGTVKAMKKHPEIDNPYALAWYMKNKGAKSHRKADGSVKEEEMKSYKQFVESLNEKAKCEEVVEESEQVEEGWDDMVKASKDANRSSKKFDIKQVGNRTIVTRKYDPETGHSVGTDEPEVKRGRGRPAGSKSGAR